MRIFAVLVDACFIFACAVSARADIKSDGVYRWPPKLVAGNNQFAIDLYRRLAKENGPIFCSPYSISTALAMAYVGARGDTATEMAKALHFELPADQLAANFGATQRQFIAATPAGGYQFRIANRLWGAEGYKFLDSFLTLTRDDFAAELSQLDFERQTEQARTTINSWVAQQTNDKIKNLIPQGGLSSDIKLVLTNAIYFKGDWELPFNKDETEKQPFHITAQTTADVELMYQQKHFRLAQTDDASVLELPYKSGQLSMVVILPKAIDGLPALEKSLTAESYNLWLGKLRRQEVRVWLPKFSATKDFELGDTLSAMGMPSAFSASAADFSGMDGQRGSVYFESDSQSLRERGRSRDRSRRGHGHHDEPNRRLPTRTARAVQSRSSVHLSIARDSIRRHLVHRPLSRAAMTD